MGTGHPSGRRTHNYMQINHAFTIGLTQLDLKNEKKLYIYHLWEMNKVED